MQFSVDFLEKKKEFFWGFGMNKIEYSGISVLRKVFRIVISDFEVIF